MKLEKTTHISVMKKEAIDNLNAAKGGTFLDCTLGGAGHTKAILEANKNNIVYALDRDNFAIERAKEFLKDFESRVHIFNTEFSNANSNIFNGVKFDGILADLGLSLDQLKENRGFSYNDDGFLDMRMNESSKITAHQIVNELEAKELFKILKEGGVGKEASAILNAILKNRPINTAKELSDVVKTATLKFKKDKKSQDVAVVFQAIRIAVNDEFLEIKKLLNNIPSIVNKNARVVIISFHSLEDKIVTSTMRSWQKGDDDMDAYLLGAKVNLGIGKLITKKALVPSEKEILENHASRSSLMRVFEFN